MRRLAISRLILMLGLMLTAVVPQQAFVPAQTPAGQAPPAEPVQIPLDA